VKVGDKVVFVVPLAELPSGLQERLKEKARFAVVDEQGRILQDKEVIFKALVAHHVTWPGAGPARPSTPSGTASLDASCSRGWPGAGKGPSPLAGNASGTRAAFRNVGVVVIVL
jgi:hypothetical protein